MLLGVSYHILSESISSVCNIISKVFPRKLLSHVPWIFRTTHPHFYAVIVMKTGSRIQMEIHLAQVFFKGPDISLIFYEFCILFYKVISIDKLFALTFNHFFRVVATAITYMRRVYTRYSRNLTPEWGKTQLVMDSYLLFSIIFKPFFFFFF